MRWRCTIGVLVVIGCVLVGLNALLLLLGIVQVPTKQIVLGPRINWPQVSYSEVRGFFYNADGIEGVPIIEDGELHKTVVNRDGVLLNASQVERLLDAVARPHSVDSRALCYWPRHAFVFFDEKHHPVAFVEICFSCTAERTSPTLQHRVGFDELRRLCKELSLPLFEDGPGERQRYLDYAARHAQKEPPQEDSQPSTSTDGDR